MKAEQEIKIERNIPIPATAERFLGAGVAGIMRKMKVGDSIVLKPPQRTTAISNARNIGIKVTTRKISPTEVRVWRIA